MDNYFLLLIPIAISISTLILAVWNTRRKAESDYVFILEKRIDDLDKRMKECEKARDELAGRNQDLINENITLLKRIVEEKILK